MPEHAFSISMKLLENYVFQIDFGEFGTIITDEPTPLGDDEGPNPVRLLAAAVGNCLAASLLFAIRKYHQDAGDVTATVTGDTERVDGRWRVSALHVELVLGQAANSIDKLDRVLSSFEDFCVVTQSVRSGIPVAVTVRDVDGAIVSN